MTPANSCRKTEYSNIGRCCEGEDDEVKDAGKMLRQVQMNVYLVTNWCFRTDTIVISQLMKVASDCNQRYRFFIFSFFFQTQSAIWSDEDFFVWLQTPHSFPWHWPTVLENYTEQLQSVLTQKPAQMQHHWMEIHELSVSINNCCECELPLMSPSGWTGALQHRLAFIDKMHHSKNCWC